MFLTSNWISIQFWRTFILSSLYEQLYTLTSKNVVGENGEWQLSNGDCTNERKCGFQIWYAKNNKFFAWRKTDIRELKQPRRRWQQERRKFEYLTMKNSSFACFAWAFLFFFIFRRRFRFFHNVKWPVLQLCGRREHMMTNMFNFVFLSLKRWFQFNSRIVGTHFASVMTLNNLEMIAETQSYIFRWRFRCRRRRVS